MYELIPLFALMLFIAFTTKIRRDSLRLIKDGRKRGSIALILSKMFFWFAFVEISYLYFYQFLIILLPMSLIIFFMYVFVDRKLLFFYKYKK